MSEHVEAAAASSSEDVTSVIWNRSATVASCSTGCYLIHPALSASPSQRDLLALSMLIGGGLASGSPVTVFHGRLCVSAIGSGPARARRSRPVESGHGPHGAASRPAARKLADSASSSESESRPRRRGYMPAAARVGPRPPQRWTRRDSSDGALEPCRGPRPAVPRGPGRFAIPRPAGRPCPPACCVPGPDLWQEELVPPLET